MARWQDRIIVKKTPNYYKEAVELMSDYFNWITQKESGENEGVAWEDKALVTNIDKFIMSASEIDELYRDVYQYLHDCKHSAQPILEPLEELEAYFNIKIEEQTEEEYGFLKDSLTMSDIDSAKDLNRDEFVTCCLMGLHELSDHSRGVEFEEGSPEEQAYFDEQVTPDFDMGELLNLITHTSISDSDQMKLLRFFQDIDSYYKKIKEALISIENICQSNYKTVKKRFEQKINYLESEEGKTYYKDLIDGLKFNIEDFRKDENIYMELGIAAYGSMAIRFHSWHRLKLLISPGILLSELTDLEDKAKARDKTTQRQLKAIADPTRYKIIKLLSNRPYYVQELADEIGLTTATLSHHLNHLLQVFLVGVDVDGRKSYYSLNSDELRSLSKYLESMAQRSRKDDI